METDYQKIRLLQQQIDRLNDQINEADNLKDRQALSKKKRAISEQILRLKQLELT
ncbi:MAG: hypothetical protein RBR40_08430 [Tenuifilaceae bacterium]|nr:hypothetical protein [Tenuifilaceae bacterium]